MNLKGRISFCKAYSYVRFLWKRRKQNGIRHRNGIRHSGIRLLLCWTGSVLACVFKIKLGSRALLNSMLYDLRCWTMCQSVWMKHLCSVWDNGLLIPDWVHYTFSFMSVISNRRVESLLLVFWKGFKGSYLFQEKNSPVSEKCIYF